MKRFSENGARPVLALGGVIPQPFGRLGALVFQPNNSELLYWASLRAPTRIAGCALGHRPMDTRWENVPSENRWASSWAPLGPQRRHHPAGALRINGPRDQPPHNQFFALDRACGAFPKDSRQQQRLLPGADASAIHGRTERSGCTAAEPYPLSRRHTVTLLQPRSQTNTTMT